MCRYMNAQDPNFIKVAGELAAVYSTILSNVQATTVPEAAPVDQLLAQLNITCHDQGMTFSATRIEWTLN